MFDRFRRRYLSLENLEERTLLAADITFAEPVNYPAGGSPGRVITGDVDGDGILDLIVGNRGCCGGGGRVSVLLGEGDGTFAPQRSFSAGQIFIGAADFDADGDLDVGVVDYLSFFVLLNEGSTGDEWNGFSEPTSRIPMDSIPQDVVSADLDNDGDIDVVVGHGGQVVRVLLNNGVSNKQWQGFAEPDDYFAGSHSSTVRAGDVDGDGDLDIVVGNYFSGDITVIIGNGDGTFQEAFDFPVGHRGSGIELGDLDGDGDLDVAVPIFNTTNVAILLGNGDGTFAERVHYPVGEAIRSLTIGDLDGDGDLDLAAVGVSHVNLLINDGHGVFVQQGRTFSVKGGSPGGINAADLDGDGDQDLAVATAYGSGLSCGGCGVEVFLNTANFNVAGEATIGVQTLGPNLARAGVASQSSTRRDSPSVVASQAIDGNPRSRSWTEDNANEHWWQVELSRNEVLDHLLLTRTSSQSLTDGGGLRIQLLSELGNEVWRETYVGAFDQPLRVELPHDRRIEARTIRLSKVAPIVSSIVLAEVEVFGRDFVLAPERVVEFDLNAEDQSSDVLRFEGNLRIAGSTLRANFLQGVPAEGMQFKLLDTVVTTGEFNQLVLPELPPGLVWNTSQLYGDGLLTIDAAGLVGDFDGDGKVGFRDFLILSSTFGEVGTGLLADADDNDMVDFNDFLLLANNFGASRA